MPFQDKRRHPRFPTELDVQYGIGQELASGKIVNIGVAGGWDCRREIPNLAGSQVELRFRLPEVNEDMRIKAVVCFSNRNRMGVQVISVPAKDAKILETIYELISRSHS